MEPASDLPPQAETRRRRWIWRLAAVSAVLGLATLLICWPPVPAHGPGRASAVLSGSPYLNTRPGVKYVGDAACLGCHANEGASYRLHPMGRSLYPITPESSAAVGGSRGAVLFEAGGLQYSIENRNGHVFHLETRRSTSGQVVAQKEAEVQYVLGSGRQAVAYLLERDGFLFQSPINWYPRANDGTWPPAMRGSTCTSTGRSRRSASSATRTSSIRCVVRSTGINSRSSMAMPSAANGATGLASCTSGVRQRSTART